MPATRNKSFNQKCKQVKKNVPFLQWRSPWDYCTMASPFPLLFPKPSNLASESACSNAGQLHSNKNITKYLCCIDRHQNANLYTKYERWHKNHRPWEKLGVKEISWQ